jgi:tetratricopeptide (TPR) repeat protein
MSAPINRLLATAAAAVAVSVGLCAQPELASTSSAEQLRRQIAELQAEGGPTPAALIEPLRALALLHEENGDHALAIAALEEARHVTRVHEGLSSANEALLLRQQIRSDKALGIHPRVWEHEQEMVTIARQNHDDIRMVTVFRELAEDRSDALEEYRAGGFPPEIELGCYYVPGLRRYGDTRGDQRPPENDGTCGSGQSASVHRRLLAETLIYYADAIEVILESGDYASQELRDLETQAFRAKQGFPDHVLQKTGGWVPVSPAIPPSSATSLCSRARVEPEALDALLSSEILASCLAPLLHGDGLVEANVGGWASLVRLIAYEIRSGAPAAARADALSDLADLYLLSAPVDDHVNNEIALELYERAYRELGQDDDARTSMFSSEVPVTLARNPFTSTATAASSRYIDVAFAITKYGRGEQIEIQETSQGATRAEERDLTRLIKNTRFRPRFVDGRLAESAPLVVRYPLGR